MNKLFFDNSIGELLEKLQKKELQPLDLVRASLENIMELDPKYLAWEVYADEALAEKILLRASLETYRQNLLQTIPIGVKDIYNTEDFPTQMGSPLWKGFTPGNDARTVFNLKRQGAVVMGKTVTAEFAVHALEKTKNPYDATKTPGTSSSGSAVAIALGMVPVATGTQTAGSIVRPASFCGVYGCKPSFGFLPRTGMLKTTDSLDTLGFFTIHQNDLKRVFDSMRVHGRDYPISHTAITDESRQHKPENRPWRVGFAKTHTWEYAPQYAKEALEGYIELLGKQKGIEIVDTILPAVMSKTHEMHSIIYNKALSYYFKGEYSQADFVSPIMNELITAGSKIEMATYMDAMQLQNRMILEMDVYFANFDILISLSTAGEAPLREVVEASDPALMWTMAHLPVVSVPQFKSLTGMPFGMQVVARKYNDYLLFEFLSYLQQLRLIPKKAVYSTE